MRYPTLQEVEDADVVQLARWHRFLPTPGATPILADAREEDGDAWEKRSDEEFAILKRITERFIGLGNWTPELSKAVGHPKEGVREVHLPDRDPLYP